MPLRIYVCGRLAIERDATIIRETGFPARQGRRLWGNLVLNRLRPISREDLAEAVWGDELPDAWHVALNTLVSRLRTAVRPVSGGGSGLDLRGEVGRYELVVPEGTFVDVERARRAVHDAETALRRGEEEAISEARVAMEIARRGFLPGEEGIWIEGVRRELAVIASRALECTIEAELRRGHAESAEREARYLITLDPLRESAYRLLMRALAAEGNVAAVPAVMAECREVLARRAAMAPSRETEHVFERLVKAD
jgi:DNA-binding SARP family transcriptional activator